MSAPLSRRALFGGAAKVAAVATLAGLPSVATAVLAPHPDAAIFTALHRWRSAVLAFVHAPQEAFSDEWEALIDMAAG